MDADLAGTASRPIPEWAAYSIVFLGGWLLFGWHLGERGLWSAHEGRAAQNAQRMLDTGQWLLPTLYIEQPDLQKPPLYYWMVAAQGLVTGRPTGPIAVRMPATLAATLGLVLVAVWGRKIWNLEIGLSAAAILAATTRYAWLGRVGRIDMPLCLFELCALYVFWSNWSESPARRLSPWFYFWLVLGVMLKGPVAAVLALLPIGSFLLVTGEPIAPFLQKGWAQTWRRLRLGPGLAAVAVLTAPWYLYAIHATDGEYFWEFLVRHNVERALGTDEGLKPGPFWFYVPRLFADAFPWTLLLPGLAIWMWRRRGMRREPVARPFLFLICWIASQFLFLSMVQFKRADYLAPIYPGLALLLAGWLGERWQRFSTRLSTRPMRNPARRARTIVVTAFTLAVLTAPLLVWGGIEFRKKGIVRSIFKHEVARSYFNATDRFMMEHVEWLVRRNWPLLAISGVVVVAGVWLLHTGWHDRRNLRIISSLALPWLVCYLFQVHLLLPAIDPVREMSRFAEEVRTLAGPDRTIHYFSKFDADLVFHAGRPARMVHDWQELARLAASEEPCFIILKADQAQWLAKNPGTASLRPVLDNRRTVFTEHRDPRVLVTNAPARAAAIGRLSRRQ